MLVRIKTYDDFCVYQCNLKLSRLTLLEILLFLFNFSQN